MPIWTTPTTYIDTISSSINNSMCNFIDEYESILPHLHDSNNIMCFSDYSGEEKEARYFVYSFLIISDHNIGEWDELRKSIRNEYLSDGRRVSYKNYRDKLSQNFIKEYLKIANKLNGYLISVSISKDILSIFENNSPINFSDPQFSEYETWTKDTPEKAFRIMHILGLFVSGFSRQHQNLIWITDDDKIAPNKERLAQLTELFADVCTEYLTHDLGHLRVGTTQTDNGDRLIEDLCAIPDLMAGAYSDQLKNSESELSDEAGKIFWIHVPNFKKKTNDLSWWLTTSTDKLCKICFRIDKDKVDKYSTSFYHFYDRD